MNEVSIEAHFPSGEKYIVERNPSGKAVRVAGPLHWNDPTDTASLNEYLDHAGSDAWDDAEWWRDQERGRTER